MYRIAASRPEAFRMRPRLPRVRHSAMLPFFVSLSAVVAFASIVFVSETFMTVAINSVPRVETRYIPCWMDQPLSEKAVDGLEVGMRVRGVPDDAYGLIAPGTFGTAVLQIDREKTGTVLGFMHRDDPDRTFVLVRWDETSWREIPERHRAVWISSFDRTVPFEAIERER